MSNLSTTNDSLRPLALITGASSGIGLELAKQFAGNGYDIVAVAENAEVNEAARAIESEGAKVTSLQADLAARDGVEALWKDVLALERPVSAAAINAGIGVGGDFRSTDLERELTLVDLNCRSTVHLAKYVVSAMSERGEGRILFTSSIAAIMPDPLEAVYGASKAFVYSFAQALHNELKDSGITVTAMQPGPTETNFFNRAGMDDTKVGQDKKDSAEDVARQGFEALMAGKDHVIVGSLKTKLQAALLSHLPEQTKAEAHRGMASPAEK